MGLVASYGSGLAVLCGAYGSNGVMGMQVIFGVSGVLLWLDGSCGLGDQVYSHSQVRGHSQNRRGVARRF